MLGVDGFLSTVMDRAKVAKYGGVHFPYRIKCRMESKGFGLYGLGVTDLRILSLEGLVGVD
jgi:hypothetical protein